MVLQNKYAFPLLTVSESEKKDDYHKQYVQAIVYRSMNEGYADRVAVANECVNFYQALQSGEEFNFLQKSEDGDTLPALWMTYSRINNKINIMVGDLIAQKYDIIVKGLNKELTSRKLKERERMRIDLRFQPLAQEMEQSVGLPLQGPQINKGGFQPETEEELDDFFDSGDYKDISEIVVKAILKYLVRVNKWDYNRIAMFRDVLIQGMAFCRTTIVDGIPVSERVDPRNMVWDTNATDDFLSDSTYFGENQYMSIGDAIDEFGLTKKELEEAYQSYSTFQQAMGFGMSSNNDFNLLGSNSNLRFFKNEGGELRVLVCRACWVDYKPFTNKISEDKYGEEHVKRVSPDATGDKIDRKIIKIWRRGTLIGGKFLKQWGEMPNQARDWSHLSNCDAPYKAVIPNYLNGRVVSKVHMMKNLQKLKDIALYRLQLDMARSGTKGFFYDITQLPAGMTLPQVLKYLKTTGVAVIDPSASGNPTGFNQFKDIDLTMSQNITAYLEIAAMVDREMDAISGINEARQGQVKNASQAVGVTQSSLFQSSLSTAVYYELFTQFCSSVLTYQARLAKLAWAGKERFAPIIGDSGVDFLSMDVDMDLHDYAVFIEQVPKMIQDEQTFQQIILAALQAGQLTFASAMKLLLEKDIQVGVRRLERETKKMLEQQAQQEQAMMQQQQAEMEAEQQMAAQAQQAQQMEGALNRQNELKKVVAKGRMDMRGDLIDFKKSVVLAKMQKELEKEKAKNRPSG